MLYRASFLVALVILTFSCEGIIDVNTKEHQPLIVVSSVIRENSQVAVQLTSSQTYPPLYDSMEVISNATVKFYEDGIFSGDLIYNESKRRTPDSYELPHLICDYRMPADYMPRPGHKYTLSVSAPGFSAVSAETFIPEAIPIISVDTSTVMIISEGYLKKTLECIVRFSDPPGKGNCYELEILRDGLHETCADWGMNCTTYEVVKKIHYHCFDANAVYFRRSRGSPGSIFPSGEEDIHYSDMFFFSDASFDGQLYALKVYIPEESLSDYADAPVPGAKFTMRKLGFNLLSINEEYYRYSRSYYMQVYRKYDMFSEPVQVYSNIRNGCGIFTSASVSIDSSIAVPVHYFIHFY